MPTATALIGAHQTCPYGSGVPHAADTGLLTRTSAGEVRGVHCQRHTRLALADHARAVRIVTGGQRAWNAAREAERDRAAARPA